MKALYWIQAQFSAAHFYNQTHWSFEKNQQIFGKCFTEYGHGHNYRVDFGFSSSLNNMQATHLQKLIQTSIDKIDHSHLNFGVAEFKTTIPTTENIALYLAEQIKNIQSPHSFQYKLQKVKLFETDDIWVELEL